MQSKVPSMFLCMTEIQDIVQQICFSIGKPAYASKRMMNNIPDVWQQTVALIFKTVTAGF